MSAGTHRHAVWLCTETLARTQPAMFRQRIAAASWPRKHSITSRATTVRGHATRHGCRSAHPHRRRVRRLGAAPATARGSAARASLGPRRVVRLGPADDGSPLLQDRRESYDEPAATDGRGAKTVEDRQVSFCPNVETALFLVDPNLRIP